MLGLFLILPVFALYAEHLEGVTPTLIGLALGAYGLTMALLQIPFGMLSDRIGRKPVITAGLIVFAIGSVIAAGSHDIWGVIIGRALQGAGAIAAAMMALLADLTREEVRTKATAMIGMPRSMAGCCDRSQWYFLADGGTGCGCYCGVAYHDPNTGSQHHAPGCRNRACPIGCCIAQYRIAATRCGDSHSPFYYDCHVYRIAIRAA